MPDDVVFDTSESVGTVLETLHKFSALGRDKDADGDAARVIGAVAVHEQELPLKRILKDVLSAENRKLLFVEASGKGPPRLLRVFALSDTWRLLLGDDPFWDQPSAAARDARDMEVSDVSGS